MERLWHRLPSDIVSIFIKHFSSIQSSSVLCSENRLTPLSTTFSFSEVPEHLVLKKLTTLYVRKATGPDGISTKLLRMVAPAISSSLTTLFNSSLSQGCFPTEWKEANVTPVPQSGDKHSVNNCSPISVIPVLAKVLESIVHHTFERGASGFQTE